MDGMDREEMEELFFVANGKKPELGELDALAMMLNNLANFEPSSVKNDSIQNVCPKQPSAKPIGNLNEQSPAKQSTISTEQQRKYRLKIQTDHEPVGPPATLHLKGTNRCIIISNQYNDSLQPPLPQYAVDEENISRTFAWLNFDVDKETDLSANEIETYMNTLAKEDFDEYECIVMFLLAHGNDQEEIAGNDSKFLKIDNIVKKLQSIPSLRGKPKIVFVQACRGSIHDVAVESAVQTADTKRASIQRSDKADTLVYWCTQPGYASYVSSIIGSFFIHKLCVVLREYAGKYHFNDVIAKVNDIISSYVRRDKQHDVLVQACQVHSSLTSHIYFQPKGQFNDFKENYKYETLV